MWICIYNAPPRVESAFTRPFVERKLYTSADGKQESDIKVCLIYAY